MKRCICHFTKCQIHPSISNIYDIATGGNPALFRAVPALVGFVHTLVLRADILYYMNFDLFRSQVLVNLLTARAMEITPLQAINNHFNCNALN